MKLKYYLAAILLLLPILFFGCQDKSANPDTIAGAGLSEPDLPEETPAQSGELAQHIPEAQDEGEQSSQIEIVYDYAQNSALGLIPGGEELMGDEDGLFLLKEYGAEMKWMEAGQIENLDRGTAAAEAGDGYIYYLLVPKYTGSRIEINRKDSDDDGFSPEKAIYLNESTPDSYGLIITNAMLETDLDMSVTVSYAGEKYRHRFNDDVRAGRPAVRVLPRDELWWENLPKTRELTVEVKPEYGDKPEYTLRMEAPTAWEVHHDDGYTRFQVTQYIDSRYMTYNFWFSYITGSPARDLIYSESHLPAVSFALGDGRDCHQSTITDSPPAYGYAFETGGLTVVLGGNIIGGENDIRPPHVTTPEFTEFLQSIELAG